MNYLKQFKLILLVNILQILVLGSNTSLIRRHGDHSKSLNHDEHKDLDLNKLEKSICGNVLLNEDYDMGLHVSAIFLIMGLSGLGCGFTALSKRIKVFQVPTVFIEVGRHFGSGVILSTAFVHMLTGAILNLTDACIPDFFKGYTAFAPLIALTAALAMHLIELVVSSHFAHNKSHNFDGLGDPDFIPLDEKPQGHTHTHFHLDSNRDITTYILELGILSHSVFIGISLGVTSGSAFPPLLAAIIFHQFFEGIGLGARIAELKSKSARPMVMVLMFSLTTAMGLIVGIIIRSSYSASSPSALAVQGIFDAISAGILIYTGLVELVGRELSLDSDFGNHPWSRRSLYLGSLYLGVASMAIIGIWA